MDSIIWVAIIGLPAQLIVALATYQKAKSADRAVNHRVTGSTISTDIMDMKVQLRDLTRELVWLRREFYEHMRSHADDNK